MNLIDRFRASLKAFRLTWSRAQSFGLTWLAGTKFDYHAAAGDGRTNAAVVACIRFVQRALTEAPLTVYQRNADGELDPAPTHPLQALIERPNPHYGGMHLLGATVADLMLTGNAYILKVRNGSGRPVELWWTPAATVEPRWADDGSEYIGWYEYAVDGRITRIAIEDVIHIRSLMPDPRNIRKGLSDLECLFREIATDNEAANWTAAMVRNVNPPGVILSPEGDVGPSPEDLAVTKQLFKDTFGGDKRGEPMVMSGPTKVSILSFSPEQMSLREIRNIPEERITAVFGLPASVVGLGTGLEQTKVGATMDQQRQQAYDSCLLPLHRDIADQLQMQLVPDFGDTARLRVRFDTSEVGILQDDQNALHERVRADWLAGLYTLNQALQAVGEDPIDGEQGDVRLLPNTVTVKTLDTLIPEEQPAAIAEPTPLRALPPGPDDDEEAVRIASRAWQELKLKPNEHGEYVFGMPVVEKAVNPSGSDPFSFKDLTADEWADRYEIGLAFLSEDLADDLMGAFEEIAEIAAQRTVSKTRSMVWGVPVAEETKAPGDAIEGIVRIEDHDPIKRLLRSCVLKGMRQAAEDLADLTDGPVRIQRNNPAVRAAIEEMEERLIGMAATTAEDFGRLLRRLERRPGSVSLETVKEALLAYVAESYPSRAELIARTELSIAHGAGVLHVAKRTGLTDRVRVIDGDQDAECAAAHGQTWTLEEAGARRSSHPNCVRRFVPLVEDAA